MQVLLNELVYIQSYSHEGVCATAVGYEDGKADWELNVDNGCERN